MGLLEWSLRHVFVVAVQPHALPASAAHPAHAFALDFQQEQAVFAMEEEEVELTLPRSSLFDVAQATVDEPVVVERIT